MTFEWDDNKNRLNKEKHGVGFEEAVEAFCDHQALWLYDAKHSIPGEKRFHWFGRVASGDIITVRFTRRDRYIRMIGAGFWRIGRSRYVDSEDP